MDATHSHRLPTKSRVTSVTIVLCVLTLFGANGLSAITIEDPDYSSANGRVSGITFNAATQIHQIGYEPFGPVNGWRAE